MKSTKELRLKIINHHLSNYNSSPIELSRHEVNRLIKVDCDCEQCGTSIFELEDYPSIERKEVICSRCYHEKYEATCPICEEYFLKATKPSEEKIIVTKEAFKELGLDKPGFYQVTSYPYYRACIVVGVEQLYSDSMKLIRECDINSMHKKLYGNGDITSGECCHDCAGKYTGQIRIKNNYANKAYGKKRIVLERQVIKEGK